MSVLTLNVDEVMRTLSAESSNPFVTHDKEVDIVRFAINSGFADIVLDGQVALRVMYQRPGETEVRAQTLTYYDTDGLRNYYDWQLLSADLTEKGTLTVALCILRTDGDVEEWHTTPCQIRVLDTIHTDDSDEGDETITPTVAQRVAVLESMIQRVASGAPVVVASTSAMTDTDQIYVLTTDGKWYYYDGSAWVAGGEYGAVATDTTLTQSGIPADAKVVGDAIAAIEPGLSNDAKVALLNCFAHVAWIDEHGQDYYDTLESALYPSVYPKIVAVFNSGQNTIYTDDTLDSLKQYLTVTYFETEESTGTVVSSANYTLSGTLVVGTSTITVVYNNLTTSFKINNVVDFYNILEWSESNGLAISKGNIVTEYTTTIVSNETSTNRGIAYCSRGKKDIYKYNSGNLVSFDPKKYPIPMPVGTKRVTMTYTGLFLANVNLYKYNDNTDTYTWNGQPTYTTRVNGEVSFEIDVQDENNFALPMFLIGTNGNLPTDVNLTFDLD